MRADLASAVYEGVVTHHRHVPTEHAFSYRIAQLYLDLDELDDVFADRWFWSLNRRNLAEFRRSDYLGPEGMPLADAVRDRVAAVLGYRPDGPVRMLAHLRYAGYVFNPVTFYFCHDLQGSLVGIVAEITNTPWRERHAYVLPLEPGSTMEWIFPKAFHVSPFMPMDRDYRWRFNVPGDSLKVHMDVLCDGRTEFEAHLVLHHRRMSALALARVLWRFPLMTAKVISAIHLEALRLWLKRTPIHDHP